MAPRAARSLGHELFDRGDDVAWWAFDPHRIHEVAHALWVDTTGELESFSDRRWLTVLDDQRIANEVRLRQRREHLEAIRP